MDKKLSPESTFNRSDRQMRMWGEEGQRKLHNSSVLVVGSGLLAERVSMGLAGLGIGKLSIMDRHEINKRDKSFLVPKPKKEIKSTKMVKTLKKINPYIHIEDITTPFFTSMINFYKIKPDIIIETGNEERGKEKILSYICKHPNISFLSSYTSGKRTLVSRFNQDKENYEEILKNKNVFWNKSKIQGAVSSAVSAGIILEDICNEIVYNGTNLLNEKFSYSLDSSNRKSLEQDLEGNIGDLSSKKTLVVGAGGIGTYTAMTLADSGFKNIDILDFDEIDETNLNRQVLFYEREGAPKAKVLSERLKETHEINSNAFYGGEFKIDTNSKKFFKEKKYDVIFGCLDNMRARYLLNEFSVDNNSTYIDGGTSESGGSVISYIPKKTACLKCQKNLRLVKEKRNSCGEADPSVVMPNMVIGGLMVGEAQNILSGRDLNGKKIIYNPNFSKKVYSKNPFSHKKDCDCYVK